MNYMKSCNLFVLSLLCGAIASSLPGCGEGEKKPEVASQSEATSKPEVTPVSKKETASPATVSGKVEGGESNPTTNSAVQNSTEVSSNTATVKEKLSPELKGVWYGESVYDVDAYSARIAQLPAEEAAKLQDMVSTFATIVMAAEFRPDSVVELDMMITMKDGQQMRDRSVGTWAVVSKTATGIQVETTEYKNENQQPTKKVYNYQFIDNDHFQFVPDSISADIRDFSPRIVFQRLDQPLNEAAVAEEQDNKVIR